MTDGEVIYAWQVFEDGEWGTIAAAIGDIVMSPVPLVHRSLLMIRRLEPLARNHAQLTGLPIRLAKFTLTEVLEEVTP
jgi:hypothetical protein